MYCGIVAVVIVVIDTSVVYIVLYVVVIVISIAVVYRYRYVVVLITVVGDVVVGSSNSRCSSNRYRYSRRNCRWLNCVYKCIDDCLGYSCVCIDSAQYYYCMSIYSSQYCCNYVYLAVYRYGFFLGILNIP
ncbi:MAG: hypothetical protein LM582_03810 [Desulfurococcaceae archaeon]|nr:hypothetical protein [Desulfurococcaceae archaeon]